MISSSDDDPPGAATLAIVARELAALRDGVDEQLVTARSLTAATDWQSTSARVFHQRAEAWAEEVRRLGPLLDAARLEALDARRCLVDQHVWSRTLERLAVAS